MSLSVVCCRVCHSDNSRVPLVSKTLVFAAFVFKFFASVAETSTVAVTTPVVPVTPLAPLSIIFRADTSLLSVIVSLTSIFTSEDLPNIAWYLVEVADPLINFVDAAKNYC